MDLSEDRAWHWGQDRFLTRASAPDTGAGKCTGPQGRQPGSESPALGRLLNLLRLPCQLSRDNTATPASSFCLLNDKAPARSPAQGTPAQSGRQRWLLGGLLCPMSLLSKAGKITRLDAFSVHKQMNSICTLRNHHNKSSHHPSLP